MDNIELEIKKEALNEIAKLAVLRKTGGTRSGFKACWSRKPTNLVNDVIFNLFWTRVRLPTPPPNLDGR